MIKNENVLLFVLKFRWKSRILLLFFRFFQKFSLSLLKKKSKSFLSLLSLFFLSWKWKFLSRNKISQCFDNFVKISLIYVKIRRSRLFNSSMNSAISFVEKYDLRWRSLLIVSVSRCLCLCSCFFVFRFRFLSKILQERFHVSFHFSINLEKKNVKYFSNFWKTQIRQRKLLKFFQH